MKKVFTFLLVCFLSSGGYAIHFLPGLISHTSSKSATAGQRVALTANPTTQNGILSIQGMTAVGDTITSFPYFENFENLPVSWTSGGTNSSWVLATPNATVINSAASGVNSWVTNDIGLYNNSENSFVQGPCFDFTSVPNPVIRMSIWWSSEFSWDGSNLQSSIDGGTTWQNVGAFGDPNNWYTDNTINGAPGGSQVGWSGQGTTGSGGWVTAEHDLDNLGGIAYVILRVTFGSDPSVQGEGFAFDNVSIFEKPPLNLEANLIEAPLSGCGLTSTDTVKMTVTNVGTQTVDSVNYSYRINGGTAVTELGIDSIPVGQSYTYTFTTTADLSTVGATYIFDAWASLTGDTDTGNDSLFNHEVVHIPTVSSFPYYQGFESGAGGWTVNGNVTSWERGAPGKAVINSAAAGTFAFVTNDSAASGVNEDGYVLSPCFDLSGLTNPAIRMDIWYEAGFGEGSNLEYSLDQGLTWNLVGAFGDPNNWYNNTSLFVNGSFVGTGWSGAFGNGSNGWVKARHRVPALAGQSAVLLRVNFYADGFNGLDGFAFDNFEVYEAPTTDAGVNAISSITSNCGLSANEMISGLASNLGQDTLFGLVVGYSVNGVQGGTQTFTQTIPPGTFVPFNFSGINLSTAGTYEICAYTILAADTTVNNDSSCFIVENQPLIGSFPYFENFESGTGSWASGGVNNSWELTTPANTVINSAGSGINSWVTNANGPYNNGENSFVQGPCFDFSTLTDPVVRLKVWWNSEFSWDGSNIQTSIDSGATWQNVGIFGDPNNWYTDNTITGNPGGSQEGWSGNIFNAGSGAWVIAEHDLDNLGGEPNVRIRVTFGSDGSVQDEGVAFDDIEIFQKPPQNIAAVSMPSPVSGCNLTDSTLIEFTITNVGTVTVDSITYSYQINGGPIISELGIDSVQVGQSYTYIFGTPADLGISGSTYTINLWAQVPGDSDAGNDSLLNLLVTHIPQIATFPYFENFESGNGGWISGGANNSWQLATPANTVINSAFSGINSWVTNATGLYNNSENSFVGGPCFDFSSLSDPVIRAKVWWNSEFSWDGANLQSSIDDGATWQNVGAFGDPDNWYTDNTINGAPGGSQEGWSGRGTTGSGGWVTAKHKLDNLGGEPAVLLRVTFGADGSVQDEGFAFDDIEIFQNPPYNAEMVAVIEPVSGCGLSDSTYITVQVNNVGSATMDSMTFGYSLNGGPAVLEFTPDSVVFGGTYTYTFLTSADFGTANTAYGLDVWVTAVGDTDAGNDSLLNLSILHKNAISTFPYVQTFDTPGGALPTDWDNDANDSGSDWIFDSGGTPTFGTGPSVDHTFGTAAGFYAYVEDNFGNPADDSVVLITPCFDVTGAIYGTKFSFWYHSNNSQGIGGTNENQLHIDLIYNGTLTLDFIPPIIHKDNNWNFIELDMSTYVGIYAIAFRVDAENGGGTHDIAIDDIGVKEILPQDAGISSFFNPQSGCGLGNDTLQIGLENFGTDTIFSVDVSYQINGGTVTTITYTDTLLPGGLDVLSFGPINFGTPGTYSISAWTSSLTGDTDQTNDSLFVDVNSIPLVATYPYFEDFENGNGGWVPVNNDAALGAENGTWELATPANTVMNSAASGVNSYVTNATGPYSANEDSWVVGPCFDFSALVFPVVEMSVWWNSEFSWDGSNLQSSIDGGATWQNVGAFGDPDNWYNDNTIVGAPGGSQEGWTGSGANSSGGWVIAKHDLTGLGGEPDVKLRVTFGSDASVQVEGFAFDDIYIADKPSTDIGATAFLSPAAGGCSDDSVLVMLQIINFGILPQTGFPLTANYSGAASGSFTQTVTDTLQPGDTLALIMGYLNTNAGGTYNFAGFTGLVGDTTLFNDSTFLSSTFTVTSQAPIAVDDSICQTDSAQFTLMALPSNAVDTTIVWFDSLTGGTQLAIGGTFVTPFLSTNTTYYAQAGTGSGASGALTTFPNFAGGNGSAGNMFDFTALSGDITIDSIDMNINGTAPLTVEVYYTTAAGGYAANNTNAAAWTLLGSVSVTPNGAGVATPITGLPSLTIPAGQTYGIYATVTTGSVAYTNGTVGDFDDNGDIRLDYGYGLGYPFGTPFIVRVWNGTIHYSSGCPSPRVPVNAIILPPAQVNLGPDAVACAGFVADASNATIVSYLWNTGETTPSIVIDTTGTYYVDIISIDGCQGSDTLNMTILPSPFVDLGADSVVSCGDIILDAGNPGSSYIWSEPGQFNQTLTVTQTGLYTVEADLNGCTDRDTVFVVILPTPSVDLGADIPACDDVTLDAGNPGASYLWSTGATTQTIVRPAPTANDTVSVTVTNSDGCTAADEVVISVGVPPTVDLGADTTNCDNVLLDAGNPGATYLWSTGATTQTITATVGGDVSVTVTDAFGCFNADTINVTLEFSPTADFTANQPNWGFNVDFTNLSTPGASYVWDFGDGTPTSTDVNPSHNYAFEGAYTVILTVTNDCGSDTKEFVLGSIGVEDELFSQSIEIFPNPTSGAFIIASDDLRADELTIEIYDAKGAMIYRQVKRQVFGLEHAVNLTSHAEGVYMVKISDGERTATKRVVRK